MKLGVLVSGEGTNLQALLDAGISIAVVVSNNPGARALERAHAAGVRAEVVDHRGLAREVFEDRLLAALGDVDALVLAGFMRVLTAHFVERFPSRMINTHPSLLPAFPGKGAIEQALAHGVKVTGVTIHFVDASLDGGPIIAQDVVAVQPDDTVATLRARIQAREHPLIVQVVRALAQGRVACEGRRVVMRAE